MQGDHLVTIEGRNVVIEALKSSRHIKNIYIDNASEGKKVELIINEAKKRKIPIKMVSRSELKKISVTENDQGVIATAESIKSTTTKDFLKKIDLSEDVTVVLLRDITYEHNLGAIIRTCAGANVSAVVVPKSRKSKITPLVERISMGGINEVSIIEESFYSSLSLFKNSGFKVVAIEVNGTKNYFEEDLTGNVVFVFGNESETLDSPVLKHVDSTVRIPMNSSIPSLNVSVAAGILLYERVRQQLTK